MIDAAIGEKLLELGAVQPMAFNDATGVISESHLKDFLGKIDGSGSTTLPVTGIADAPTHETSAWHHDAATKAGGVHPITQADAGRRSALPRHLLWRRLAPPLCSQDLRVGVLYGLMAEVHHEHSTT